MANDPLDTWTLPIVDEDDARRRFEKYEQLDPLPKVPPALLNSGDICDYVRITGMICPFPGDNRQLQRKLKSASFEVDFLGTVYFIDEQGESREQAITIDTPFALKKNSIAYVCLATTFRLPDYMALRFNLRIHHVHRGLLLGTGPLVDAGFCGNLLIPLHNLTSRDYFLTGGEGLIWVEFTKLSPHRSWDVDRRAGARDGSYDYFRFPIENRYSSAQKYLNKATGDGRPAESSIRGEIMAARKAAEKAGEEAGKAKQEAEKAKKSSELLLYVGSVVVFLAAAALVYSSYALVYSSYDVASSANKNIADYRGEVSQMEKRSEEHHLETSGLIAALAADVKALKTPASKNYTPRQQKNRRNRK